jgi:hypothetical protein
MQQTTSQDAISSQVLEPRPSEILATIKQLEFETFGEHFLTEKMATGIVKQALSIKRHMDHPWLINQIKSLRRSLDIQKMESGQPGASPSTPALPGEALFQSQKRPHPVKAINGADKIEITLRFTDVPIWSEEKGRVFFRINSSGFVWDISVNRKSMRKAFEIFSVDTPWVAMVKGKIGKETPRGFIVDDAGLQVFQKNSNHQPEATQ